MQTLAITLDVSVVVLAALLAAFSIMVHRHASFAVLLSSYVSYVTILLWGDRITTVAAGQRISVSGVSYDIANLAIPIPVIIFWILILGVAGLGKLDGRGKQRSVPEVVVYALVAAAVISVLSLSLFSPEARQMYIHRSGILPLLYNGRDWVLAAPIALVILFSFKRGDE